jgi:hypothetical protein
LIDWIKTVLIENEQTVSPDDLKLIKLSTRKTKSWKF